MLPSSEKLKTSTEIKKVLRQGIKVYSNLFTLCYLPNQRDNLKVCVIIGLKIAKSAVIRNRSRRQVFASLVQIKKEQIFHGQLVFTLKKEIIEKDFQEVFTEVKRCLKRLSYPQSPFIKKPSHLITHQLGKKDSPKGTVDTSQPVANTPSKL